MLVALLEPPWKPTHSLQSCDSFDIWSHQPPLSLDHAQTKINVWVQACSQGPCVILTCNVRTAHVSDCNVQPLLTGHSWQNACMRGDRYNIKRRDRDSLLAGLLCFRPLLPRLECQNCQKKPDQLLSYCLEAVCCLSDITRNKKKRERMTQSEGKDTTASPYSWETRSLCCVQQYIICSINI